VKKIIIFTITLYQKYISPLKPATCRFYPTCSEYTVQALTRFGLVKGIWLSIKRILRCHPFNPGGYDPVPDSFQASRMREKL
jgi:putative membrane protein insertion efficiency factor